MKMRILIITGIFPPDIGGPATYVPQMATALAVRGHTITVMTLSDEKNPLSLAEYPFQLVRLPRQAFKPWRWLLTVLTIVRLGRRADVLFVNGLALEAVLANVVLRKPLVQKIVGDLAWERATNWGWVHESFEDFQKRRYDTKIEALKALRAWWTRQTDRIIVPSQYLAQWIVQWGVPEEKISVIYNAVEPPNGIKPAPLLFEHLLTTTPIKLKVVTVGRLIPLKRVDKVLEAIAQLDNLGLVVVGDGPERGRLEALASALGIADHVLFAGQKSKAETLAIMAACDIFVLNSTHEGFPHVVLEAMSLGLPVVATAVGGMPEAVRNRQNGLLIDLSHDGLIQALNHLVYSDDLRKKLSEQGHKLASQNFIISLMVEHVEQLLTHEVTTSLRNIQCRKGDIWKWKN